MARGPARRPVPARWALQDAKKRLSEVVDAALTGQPQIVTRRGIETAVIVSRDEYARLMAARNAQRKPLAAYLLDVPPADTDREALSERITLRGRRRV